MEILNYFFQALSPLNIFLALAGVILGTIIGALPGLSATMAVAVLVPFTFAMNPVSGLIALGAIYTGAIYGGAFAAILVNTPGTPSAIATTFDGYPMAKKGQGGLAISLATFSSVFGGLVGAISLLLLSPPLAKIALAFGPPEYFWLAVFGLTLISALSAGNTLKGLIGAAIGLMLSIVGVAVVGGDVRYTMEIQGFLGGIDITSALIGLYCIPVLIDLVSTKDPHLKVEVSTKEIKLNVAVSILLKEKFNLVRSSILGTLIGVLPGAGGSIAGLIAYTEAKRASVHSDNFGKGEPGGIIATESANNATVGGGFIPTLVLGIPGTPPDAIILGALLVQGIKIGPALFTSEGDIVYTFIFGLLIATVLMLPVGLIIGKYLYKSIIAFPKALLIPTIAFLTVIGSFAIHSNIHDAKIMLILGIFAWTLNRFGFKPSPIVLGLVLGKIAEQGFVQSYLIGSASNNVFGMFFTRPISLGIIILALLTLLFPFYQQIKSSRLKKSQVSSELEANAEQKRNTPSASKYYRMSEILIAISLLVISIFAIIEASTMTEMGAVFPKTISTSIIIFSCVLIILSLLGKTKGSMEDADKTPYYFRSLYLIAIMFAWIWLLSVLGFLWASIFAFILLMIISEYEKVTWSKWTQRLVISVLIVSSFYWLMNHVLLLRMPQGTLF